MTNSSIYSDIYFNTSAFEYYSKVGSLSVGVVINDICLQWHTGVCNFHVFAFWLFMLGMIIRGINKYFGKYIEVNIPSFYLIPIDDINKIKNSKIRKLVKKLTYVSPSDNFNILFWIEEGIYNIIFARAIYIMLLPYG